MPRTEIGEAVAQNIKRLRKAAGLTRAALSERIGVAPSSIQRWEMGSWPNPANIKALADVFGVPPEVIFARADVVVKMPDGQSYSSSPKTPFDKQRQPRREKQVRELGKSDDLLRFSSEVGIARIFAENLRRLVKQKGLAIRLVAAEVGVNRNTMTRWMNAESLPQPSNVEALSHLLEIEEFLLFVPHHLWHQLTKMPEKVKTTDFEPNPERAIEPAAAQSVSPGENRQQRITLLMDRYERLISRLETFEQTSRRQRQEVDDELREVKRLLREELEIRKK